MKPLLKILNLILFIISFSNQAQATVYTTLFIKSSILDTSAGGNLGLSFLTTSPNSPFATLTFNSVSNLFTLNAASNLDSFFGENSYIDAIAFNTPQARGDINDANVSGGGITDFAESTNDVPDFGAGAEDDFNVLYRAGTNTELVAGETVTFTITGLNPNCFTSESCTQNNIALPATSFAIRITNNPEGNSNTAISWAMGASIDPVLAVPEVETSSMFLAGLGLLSFVSVRRKLNFL